MLVACLVNIAGDLILVAGFGMDAAGAAIATVLAQAVSVVFAVALLIKKKLPFAITRADFRLNPQCRKFLSIGLPLALQEFLTQLSFLALCAFVNRLGLTASSGYGVASKIVNFAMLIPSALMQSMASFVAQNVGAGNQKRARQSMLTGIGVGLFFGCAVFALVMLKGDVLAGIFSPDTEVVQKGFEYLKGFAPETILTAILFQHARLLQRQQQDALGHGTGAHPNAARPPAVCVCDEHPAEREPDEDRPCRAGVHAGRRGS